MFKLEQKYSYMMPAHFGPRYTGVESSGWYHDVTMMAISYVTDAAKLSAHIPSPFRVADVPVVTVVCAQNRKIDWLAGHGYNLIAVNAQVVYEGPEETLSGTYTLVMWENLADPILTGRELQGIPKIFASIDDITIGDDRWSSSANHFDNKIVDLSIDNLRPPTEAEIGAAAAAEKAGNHPMAWRYFPGVAGGGNAVNEFTTFPSETIYREAMVGEGHIDWQRLTWEQNPTQFHIVNALADLPVLATLPSMAAKGSVNLILPDNPARILT